MRKRESDSLSRGKFPSLRVNEDLRVVVPCEALVAGVVLRDKGSITGIGKGGEGKSAARRQSVGKLGYINIFCFRTHLCFFRLLAPPLSCSSFSTSSSFSPTVRTRRRYTCFLPVMRISLVPYRSHRVIYNIYATPYLRSSFLHSISFEIEGETTSSRRIEFAIAIVRTYYGASPSTPSYYRITMI